MWRRLYDTNLHVKSQLVSNPYWYPFRPDTSYQLPRRYWRYIDITLSFFFTDSVPRARRVDVFVGFTGLDF